MDENKADVLPINFFIRATSLYFHFLFPAIIIFLTFFYFSLSFKFNEHILLIFCTFSLACLYDREPILSL